MYSARHFGIDKTDGLAKTFMSNDWMHGIFVNEPSDDKIKAIAALIIGSEICLSAGMLIYFQSNNVSNKREEKREPSLQGQPFQPVQFVNTP